MFAFAGISILLVFSKVFLILFHFFFVQANTSDHYGARLAEKLSDGGSGFKVVCATNPAEVRASLTCLVAKIQVLDHFHYKYVVRISHSLYNSN